MSPVGPNLLSSNKGSLSQIQNPTKEVTRLPSLANVKQQ